jgi:hypothetical protein
MATDTRLVLASAVVWLDPSHIVTHQDGIRDEDFDEDEITQTLYLCRHLFPDVYAHAMQQIWRGIDTPGLEGVLLDGINSHLVMKLTSLEEIIGGIPVETVGISFYEDNFFENYPHLADILMDFAIQPDCTDDDLHRASELARGLRISLEQQPSKTNLNISRLLSWMFGSSGNTCVDMTNEEFWESGMELLDWDAENVAFMNEMATEALSILDEAELGVHTLRHDTVLRQAFQTNIRKLGNCPMKRDPRKGNASYDRYLKRLKWPERP